MKAPLIAAFVLIAAAASAQTPRLSNGRIEPHTTTNIARDVQQLASTLTEPAWIGYTQPLIDGDHNMCDYTTINGRMITQSTDPIHLEPVGYFFVMFRVEEKQITRIRTFSENCPLDAGGKAVHWFNNVPVSDSVNYMKTFMSPAATRRLNDSAVTVIAMTKGDQALNELLTIAKNGATPQAKGNALFWLAQRAGDKAVGTITAAIENDPDTEVKKKAVFALSHFSAWEFPALFLFGLGAAVLAVRTGRLGPGIVAHLGFNAVAAFFLLR